LWQSGERKKNSYEENGKISNGDCTTMCSDEEHIGVERTEEKSHLEVNGPSNEEMSLKEN